MNKYTFLSVFCFLMVLFSQAQERLVIQLKGKVLSKTIDLEGINVINSKTEKIAITALGGYFSIPVCEGDTLTFSAVQFKGIRIAITASDIVKPLLFVKMEPIINQLNEVLIFQYKNINAVALGIIPRELQSYTPAERRLKTATGMDARIGFNTALTIDPLLNLFSGRTAELIKNIEVERKEILLKKIENRFEKTYLVQKLEIPEQFVKAFEYFRRPTFCQSF